MGGESVSPPLDVCFIRLQHGSSSNICFCVYHLSLRGIVNAGLAYELLQNGCEFAGGPSPDPAVGEKLSDKALGGRDQKCAAVVCDDGLDVSNSSIIVIQTFLCMCPSLMYLKFALFYSLCDQNTIDSCDPSKPIVNGWEDLCVNTQCPEGNRGMVVEILTDNYPGETSWTLTNGCGPTPEVIMQVDRGGYSAANTVYVDAVCAPEGQYEFKIDVRRLFLHVLLICPFYTKLQL